MNVVVVSAFYSAGMGYTENCLPKYLASMGHEVHVVTSALNVYGNSPQYEEVYETFLGPADQGVSSFVVDGYTVHRLPYRLLAGYVVLRGLSRKIRELSPDIVHCTEIASLQCFVLAALQPFLSYKLFTETHQHLSVVRPYVRERRGFNLKRAAYALTRTLPTCLASTVVEKCYAIVLDCVYVANRFYGVPTKKIVLRSLGTDTELFHPPSSGAELAEREAMREQLNYARGDVVCLYTGRLSSDKNPLLLARAVDALSREAPSFKSLFVGEGTQKAKIAACRNARVLPFVKHSELAKIYRMADIAVWPRQESMSMLDAAACGLPLVASDTIGERDRIEGNGRFYKEDSEEDLVHALLSLQSRTERESLGARGRAKMIAGFSWKQVAETVGGDYERAVVAPA
jgi:glycosyltransferase involved in cell wall biosynthesis